MLVLKLLWSKTRPSKEARERFRIKQLVLSMLLSDGPLRLVCSTLQLQHHCLVAWTNVTREGPYAQLSMDAFFIGVIYFVQEHLTKMSNGVRCAPTKTELTQPFGFIGFFCLLSLCFNSWAQFLVVLL